MEYVVLIGIVVLLLLIIFGIGIWQESRDKKKYMEHLRKCYGKERSYEYPSGRFEKIPMFYIHNKPKSFVDDITWNDLDMDEVYKAVNFTESSVGEEYVYYMLRNMECDEEAYEKQETMISYLMENEEVRVYLQMLYHSIGKRDKYSVYDYLDYMDSVKVKNNIVHIAADICLLFAIGSCFVNAGIGVLLTVSILIFNILTYFKEKKEIEPYISSLAYVQRLLDAGKKVCSMKVDVLKQNQEAIQAVLKEFKDFSSNSMWIHMNSVNASATGGSPLDIILDYVRMLTHIDLLIFGRLFKKLKGKKDKVNDLVKGLGEIEACISIGWYRKTLPFYSIPDFNGQDICLKDACHPLISHPVPNSIQAKKGILITGSNASGKSTFLKTVAMNVILAQGIHTAYANEYKAEKMDIYSSMALRDNIVSGDSYFMVEIKSIKRILDAVGSSERKVICFVDEVLRGTNTVERIAASTHILYGLQKAKTLCFAATHDIELAMLLEEFYENYHFEETILDDDVKFSYMLCQGKAGSRNAIKLLKVLGYDKEIIQNAENMAVHFLETGKWNALGKDSCFEG